MNKIAFLLAFLTLIGYLISQNYASFYMLKGFQNALYLNVSPSSFTLTYPINSIATTTINVYATYIPYNAFGNASVYLQGLNNIMLSGINGSIFLGNLSFIPYGNGILIPKYTLQGNTYKTLAFYYNGNAGYSKYPWLVKSYIDNLQNNYQFVYFSFLNYNLTTTQAQTIPAQPNNNTNTGGTFKVSFDTLPIPYFLLTAPNTSYLNLTYYRGTGAIARQIQAVYSNSNALLIGNGNVYKQTALVDNGLLLNPNGNIWLGYLNMPLYYYNYNITNASTKSSVPIGLYYSTYNYILNILMPNTQKVYSSPSYFYYLIPAYANANIIAQITQQQNVSNLPNFEYQFNLTNINWTMRPSDWLTWSGGYTIHNFNTLNTTQNPSFTTKYLMFSLPAYPCLQTIDGNYGAIQVFGYSGSTNLGRIQVAEWQKQGNTVYYVIPNTTTKGLTYSNATVYICTPQPILSQLNSSLAVQFVIAKYSGSGNANPNQYFTYQSDGILFVNPKLFYGNEYFSLWNDSSGFVQYSMVKAQSLSLNGSAAFNPSTSTYVKILANYPLYITYARQVWAGAFVGELWFGGGMVNLPSYIAEYSNFPVFVSNSTTTKSYTWVSNLKGVSLNVSLPYNASMTLVNYFTTKYTQGQLEPVATTSSSSGSGVSNPVILPSSPKLNLSITNTTLTNNLNNLKQEFSKQVVLYGMNIPLGLIYIVDLFLIVALAIFSKHEGAFIIALAIFWFSGLLFIQQLVIAAIITIAYATYRLEGIFHKEG